MHGLVDSSNAEYGAASLGDGRMPASVSVLIPAYNVAPIIEKAIESAASQTRPPLEILVIDDCSTDETAEVVKRAQSRFPSLRLLSTPTNGGPGVARNIGLRAARGDWIGLLDGDDAWKPVRLERLLAVAEQWSADWVADNILEWDVNTDKPVREALSLPEPVQAMTAYDLFANDAQHFDFRGYSWGGLQPILRRSFLEKHGIEYSGTLRTGEDFRFYADILFNGAKAVVMQEAYYVYHIPMPPSGPSPYSHSQHNFEKMIEMSKALRQEYSDRIDSRLSNVMIRREQVMSLIHQSNVARGYRRSRDYGAYLSYVGARPALAGALLARSAGRLLRRFIPPSPKAA